MSTPDCYSAWGTGEKSVFSATRVKVPACLTQDSAAASVPGVNRVADKRFQNQKVLIINIFTR